MISRAIGGQRTIVPVLKLKAIFQHEYVIYPVMPLPDQLGAGFEPHFADDVEIAVIPKLLREAFEFAQR